MVVNSVSFRLLRSRQVLLPLFLLLVLALTGCSGQEIDPPTFNLGGETLDANNPQLVSGGLQILILVTVLSLAPAILVMVTAFTRIVIVLSFVRTALAAPQVPPNQVLIGLALFLTMFVMAPTWTDINNDAIQPYLNGEVGQEIAAQTAIGHVRTFLFSQTRERDIALFMHLSDLPRPKTPDDVPTYVVIPAFIISELKTAFQMGLVIFVPFLIIDMVVASALMSMGMMMLPPIPYLFTL
jgi:flagellar biosynthetic protein FliP